MSTNCWSRTGQAGFRFAVVFALLSQGLAPATAWNEAGTNANGPQGAAGRQELVPDPAVYAAAKAAANRAAGHGPPVLSDDCEASDELFEGVQRWLGG